MTQADETADKLELELRCTECGAGVVVGIWDHSVRCGYCGSLLVCGRALGDEVFVVSDERPGALDVVALLVAAETESYRNELIGRTRNQEGLSLEIPTLVEARVEALRAQLLASLELEESVEFLVPYELHERTVLQSVLGRRGAAKESFMQSFLTEDLERRYDAAQWNLRDRGLKIRGSRLVLLREEHLANAGGRILSEADAAPAAPKRQAERTRLKVDAKLQVISQIQGVMRERRLRIWKHMAYARVRRGAGREEYLLDRQFDTVAGRLVAGEAARFQALAPRALDEVFAKPDLHTVASECPNCGASLELPRRAQIAFCATCGLGMRVEARGLETCPYLAGPDAPGAARDAVAYPFWAFPFRLRAGGREFARVWDWLEAVSPQPAAQRFREADPAESRLFVPARATFGSRDLDDAFAALAACTTWRQPELRVQRLDPGTGLSLLDVELEPEDAAPLARFALVALHDQQSTRRLNGVTFRSFIADAELSLGAPDLALVPLPLHDDAWIPCPAAAAGDPNATPPGFRAVPRAVLADDGSLPRLSRAFSLF